jgi:hypothetical protein
MAAEEDCLLLVLATKPYPMVYTQWSNNFLDINSPEVDNFHSHLLLRPECRHIGTDPHDTMASFTIIWIPIYRRLGTRRLGTVTLCISFVD